MAQMIAGLEIGQSDIKLVILSRKFTSLELLESVIVQLDVGLSLNDRLVVGIKKMNRANRLGECDLITVSLPGDYYSVRQLALPFDDPNKIAHVLPFEIESQLPFAVEEIVADYHVTSREPGRTGMLVAVMLRSDISCFLDIFASAGLDPATVTIGPFALFNFYSYFSGVGADVGNVEGVDGAVLIVNICRQVTNIILTRNGKLAGVRTIGIGACHIYQTDEGVETGAGVDLEVDEGVSDRLAGEIYLTAQALSGPDNDVGGNDVNDNDAPGLLLDGIEVDGLREKIKLETVDFNLAARDKKFDPKQVGSQFHVTCGLALSQVLGAGCVNLNFRQGSLSHQKADNNRKTAIITLLLAVFLIACAAGGDLYLWSWHQENKAGILGSEIRRVYRNNIKGAGKIVNELHQMKVAFDLLQKKKRIIGGKSNKVLFIMNGLSSAIESTVDIEEMSIEGTSMSIRAVTDSFDEVDKIRGAIAGKEFIDKIKVTDAKAAATPGKIRFKLNISLKESL